MLGAPVSETVKGLIRARGSDGEEGAMEHKG